MHMNEDPYKKVLENHKATGTKVTLHRQGSLAIGGTVIEINDGGCSIDEGDGRTIFVAFRNITGVRTSTK